ncbi:unnamed protein product [Phytomonas sp. Hart1]|nr:unnamed protein product [Phytomonas sp. Hart1]|eukprot:CCW69127.1 unnamed protein product [Phytomonas sp. isolate Hart1]
MRLHGGLLFFALLGLSLALTSATPPPDVPHALRVLRVPGGDTALYVTPYRDGILRLTLRPATRWSFTVPHSLVAGPEPWATQGRNASPAGPASVIPHGDCELALGLSATGFRVMVNYTCAGLPLVVATVHLQHAPRATLSATFPSAKAMYGLAAHAADLPLRPGNTYELFNHDAFQYPLNSTSALYGAIPFIMAYSVRATTGMLFLNAAELNVTVMGGNGHGDSPRCEWNAETGPLDLFFLPGPTPKKVQRQHAYLTGPTVFPPYFALGYHQSLVGYFNIKDALSIDEGFDQHNMPYDALWLDLEHTDSGKSFTWNSRTYPDPELLPNALASKGRRLVVLYPPMVKQKENYTVYHELEKGNHYVRNADGSVYKGECWAGECSWPDFLNAHTREWYARFFYDKRSLGKVCEPIYSWVGMNEPSVLNGPRRTMGKETVHRDDEGHSVEHRYLHNMYGLLSIISAYKGAVKAINEGVEAKRRPLLLTRSFFSGSQRYAAVSTGDNMARWDHLQSTSAELLSLSVSNYPFCGSDISGFFLDPEEELFVRWMQSGIFYPFFRSHANHKTKRREPWTFSEDAQHHIRNALALRYALIPYLYTVFYKAHCDGNTVLRPLFFEFPDENDLWEEQATFMFGPSLLVSPVVHRKATETTVRLPLSEIWYEYSTGEAITNRGSYSLPVTMGSIPLFVRGGHIVPLKLRLRRNTYAARGDPFTLYVALNAKGESRGELYLDDGITFQYKRGDSFHRLFEFSNYYLRCTNYSRASTNSTFTVPNVVERIVVMGYNRKPLRIYRMAATSKGLGLKICNKPMRFERVGNSVIVHNTKLWIGEDWEIHFENE